MSKENNNTTMALNLRRLWKGTLYIGVTGIYAFLLGMLLVHRGWRPAVLVLFLIGLGQWFRHIASDVDRIGWVLSKEEPSEKQAEEKRYQSKMLILLFALIQLLNIGIIYQAYIISTWMWALIVALIILIVEIIFGQIRSVNRRIDYESASYGIKDSSPLATGASILKHKEVDAKLVKLKRMAELGEITQKAYEKVRDRALIDRVMGD